MIKLIACDVDGTMLEWGETVLPEELLIQAERLLRKGYIFSFSSGRQFSNLRALAKHLADRFYYICDNGAVVYSDGCLPEIISLTALDRDDAVRMANEVIEMPGMELEVSGANAAYLYVKTSVFQNTLLGYEGMNLFRIRSPEQIPEEILKVSIYSEHAEDVYPIFRRKWEGKYHVAISGNQWVDITLADKGVGIRALCAHLGIGLDSVIAFGDHFNDVPILDAVGVPYIRRNAHEDLLKRYPNHFSNVTEILKTL